MDSRLRGNDGERCARMVRTHDYVVIDISLSFPRRWEFIGHHSDPHCGSFLESTESFMPGPIFSCVSMYWWNPSGGWYCTTQNWLEHRSEPYASSCSRSVQWCYAIRGESAFCFRSLSLTSACFTSWPSDWFRDSHRRVLPRHLDKQWGKGKLCLKSRKYSIRPRHSDLTTQPYPTIVN